MLIVDAHIDLAYNAVWNKRDVTRPAREQRPHVTDPRDGVPTVGLPDLRAGGVGLVCATVFCMPSLNDAPGYRTSDEAHAAGWAQVQWYRAQQAARRMRFVRNETELPQTPSRFVSTLPVPAPLPALLLLEGADPLRTPDDLPEWVDAGLRIVGLAWKQTRYAGGTGAPGPLTDDGVALVRAMDDLNLIHDASHLAEESFWQLLDRSAGPVIASHSNCRQIVPTDRQLSDDMIRAIAARGGVIGINFFDKFLLPPEEYGKRRATLADVVAHARHVCDVTGSTAHVAIGTDMDGGLGRDEIPEELDTSADLPKLAAALAAGGFADADVAAVLGGNWVRFFSRTLPHG